MQLLYFFNLLVGGLEIISNVKTSTENYFNLCIKLRHTFLSQFTSWKVEGYGFFLNSFQITRLYAGDYSKSILGLKVEAGETDWWRKFNIGSSYQQFTSKPIKSHKFWKHARYKELKQLIYLFNISLNKNHLSEHISLNSI